MFFVTGHQQRLKDQGDIPGQNVIDIESMAYNCQLRKLARRWHHKQITIIWNFFKQTDVDVLICPATPVSPFSHEQLPVTKINNRTMETYMRWLACVPTTALCCGLRYSMWT